MYTSWLGEIFAHHHYHSFQIESVGFNLDFNLNSKFLWLNRNWMLVWAKLKTRQFCINHGFSFWCDAFEGVLFNSRHFMLCRYFHVNNFFVGISYGTYIILFRKAWPIFPFLLLATFILPDAIFRELFCRMHNFSIKFIQSMRWRYLKSGKLFKNNDFDNA